MNLRPLPCQGSALPAELSPRVDNGASNGNRTRITGLGSRRSTIELYPPVCIDIITFLPVIINIIICHIWRTQYPDRKYCNICYLTENHLCFIIFIEIKYRMDHLRGRVKIPTGGTARESPQAIEPVKFRGRQ